ncbi:FecR family protein, partial [Myxococcota bacterium]|nr:FecR family protein [Myxococcota bacterium]
MKHELLNDWLRSGQPAMSDALRKHLNVCPLCASELKEIQTYQTLLAGPDPVLTEDRSAEIRFLLEAESNRKRSTREMESHPRPWFLRIPWVPVAAAAVLAGVLFGGVMLFQHAGSGDGSEKADSLARITPAPGARWSREYLSNTEIVMLEEGTIGLHVRRLAPGQSFLVKTGADWVEVRGTAFSVTASEGRLKSVDVAEGVVSVHVAAGSLLLLAGQQWSRTADRTPADRTPAEQTPADRTPAEQPPRPMNLASNPPTPPVPTEDPRIPSGLAAGNPLPPPARPPVDSMTAPTDPRTPAPEAMTAPV